MSLKTHLKARLRPFLCRIGTHDARRDGELDGDEGNAYCIYCSTRVRVQA